MLTLRISLLLAVVDFLLISYLCTHLHHYDSYFTLMLYLAIACHLYLITPAVDTAPTTSLVYNDALTVRVQAQEGSKLPSYWLYAAAL